VLHSGRLQPYLQTLNYAEKAFLGQMHLLAAYFKNCRQKCFITLAQGGHVIKNFSFHDKDAKKLACWSLESLSSQV
jgi:hypothetical protein